MIAELPSPGWIWVWLFFWIAPSIGMAIGFRTQIQDTATHTNFFGKIVGYTRYNTGRYEENAADPKGALGWH